MHFTVAFIVHPAIQDSYHCRPSVTGAGSTMNSRDRDEQSPIRKQRTPLHLFPFFCSTGTGSAMNTTESPGYRYCLSDVDQQYQIPDPVMNSTESPDEPAQPDNKTVQTQYRTVRARYGIVHTQCVFFFRLLPT